MNHTLILTNGLLRSSDAKTAHGLIRGTERFVITGVIDPPCAGQDAGSVLDAKTRGIPVFATLEEALKKGPKPDYLIIGVATVGGILPSDMVTIIEDAICQGLSIVNGLHDYLNERAELVALAKENGVQLLDIRRPKARRDLHFWSGDIFKIKCPIIAVMGTDCAIGKRTTARLLRQACAAEQINAQMIYTGQTGWLQGGKYGFIFDSTLNDFVSGELEHALLQCWEAEKPDLMLIEGQSALRNPSGPCGLEFLLSGNARYVVLVHAPKRRFYENEEHWGEIPSIESEIDVISRFNSRVLAVALNTEGCTPEEALAFQKEYETRLSMPILLPLEQGVASLMPILKSLLLP